MNPLATHGGPVAIQACVTTGPLYRRSDGQPAPAAVVTHHPPVPPVSTGSKYTGGPLACQSGAPSGLLTVGSVPHPMSARPHISADAPPRCRTAHLANPEWSPSFRLIILRRKALIARGRNQRNLRSATSCGATVRLSRTLGYVRRF